jgi:hypothetical protein
MCGDVERCKNGGSNGLTALVAAAVSGTLAFVTPVGVLLSSVLISPLII